MLSVSHRAVFSPAAPTPFCSDAPTEYDCYCELIGEEVCFSLAQLQLFAGEMFVDTVHHRN